MAGGLCSLIIRRGKFIHYERDTAKMTMLRDNILDKLSVLGPGVTVATVQRASITKYNRSKNHPDSDNSDWQTRQKEQLQLLNDDFSYLNSFIEEDRRHLGPHRYISRKPHAPKVWRRGVNKGRTKIAKLRGCIFTWMYDSTHGGSILKSVWCKNIVIASRQAILSRSAETSKESAQE